MSNRVLVTGANGFLGGHLVRLLLAAGWDVCGMDSHGGLVYGDAVLHPKAADAAVHLTWYSSAGDRHPLLQQHCLDRTLELIDRCSPDVPFVFASTASVYGDGDDREWKESDPLHPNCAYSKAKALAEAAVNGRFHRPVVFRFGSMMGLGITRTKTEVCVNGMAAEAWTRGSFDLWNPRSWKPLIHVRDAAELIVQALDEGWTGTVNAAVECLRAEQVAAIVTAATGAVANHVPDRTGQRSCRLDCRRLLDLRLGKPLPRTVEHAVREFRGFVPSTKDRDVPWVL